jgi:hypothetical protein
MPLETPMNGFESTKKRELLALVILECSELINRDYCDDEDDDEEMGDEAEIFAEEKAQKKIEDLHAKMHRAEEFFSMFYGVDMNGPAFEGEAFGTEERRAGKRAARLKKEADEEADNECEKEDPNKETGSTKEERAEEQSNAIVPAAEEEIELTASASAARKDPKEVTVSEAKASEDPKTAKAEIEVKKQTMQEVAEKRRAKQKRDESERWHESHAVAPKDHELLVGCLRIFQEGLDFSVSDQIGGGESLQTSLEREVANFGAVVRALATVSKDGDQIKKGVDAALAQIQKLTGIDQANAGSSLDSEMVQEQEQENEIEEKKRSDFGPFHDAIIDDTIHWSLDDLFDNAGTSAFPLEEVRFGRTPLNVQLPGSIRVSPNFGARQHDVENPRRLRNLDLLLKWQSKPRPKEGDGAMATPRQSTMIQSLDGSNEEPGAHYVLVSLDEAEAIINQTEQLTRHGMSLLTVTGHVVSGAETDGSKQATEELISSSSSTEVLQLLRFWNSNLLFDKHSIHALLEGLKSISLENRKCAFDAISKCRRRDRRDPAETPVESVFSYNHPSELRKQEDLIRILRATLATANRFEGDDELTLAQLFQRFDKDGNGELDAGELTTVLLTLNRDDMERVAEDTVKMLGLDKKDATVASDAFIRKLEVAADTDMTDAAGVDLMARIQDELKHDFDPPPRESLTARLKSTDAELAVDKEADTGTHKARATSTGKSEDAKGSAQLTRAQIQVVPKHLVPKDYDAIGKIGIGAGVRASTRDHNMLMAAAGSRPTLVPTGVLLESGAWYFEVEVLQSSNGGLVSIGWVNSRWQSVHNGRPSAPEGGGVGACDASWGVSASFSKRHNNEDTPFANRLIEAGDIIGCVGDIQNRTLSFSLNGACIRAPVAYHRLAA